jgi:hypothetical protein
MDGNMQESDERSHGQYKAFVINIAFAQLLKHSLFSEQSLRQRGDDQADDEGQPSTGLTEELCVMQTLLKVNHITSYHIHITSHHITSHQTALQALVKSRGGWGRRHHITPHHITSHHITSHHITSHHITSHHITSTQEGHHLSRGLDMFVLNS